MANYYQSDAYNTWLYLKLCLFFFEWGGRGQKNSSPDRVIVK